MSFTMKTSLDELNYYLNILSLLKLAVNKYTLLNINHRNLFEKCFKNIYRSIFSFFGSYALPNTKTVTE